LSRFGFGFIVWLLLIVIITINLIIARRFSSESDRGTGSGNGAGYFSQIGVSMNTVNILLIAVALIISFIIASKGSDKWDMVLRYLYQKPFGITDPTFQQGYRLLCLFPPPLLSLSGRGCYFLCFSAAC